MDDAIIFQSIYKIVVCTIFCEITLVLCARHWRLVNNGQGNGLALSGNKPLPVSMLAKSYDAIWGFDVLFAQARVH